MVKPKVAAAYGEPIGVIFLNGHVVKLPSRCLYSETCAALSLGQRSFTS